MDTNAGKREYGTPIASSAIAGSKDFNFEVWASEVKHQMINLLQRTPKNTEKNWEASVEDSHSGS